LVVLFATLVAAEETRPRHWLDSNHYLALPVTTENVTVWPVLARRTWDPGPFFTLQSAQREGRVVVRELSTASVGHLEISNKDRRRSILVPGGTVLRGGKQDRQVGQDTLIPPLATVRVRAFCIEHGRWSSSRAGRGTGGRFTCLDLVATSHVRGAAQYANNQLHVWQRVAECNGQAGLQPATGTYLAAVSKHWNAPNAMRIRRDLNRYFAALAKRAFPVVGFAYAINERPLGARCFAHPTLFAIQQSSFFAAIALEASLADASPRAHEKDESLVARTDDMARLVRAINRGAEKDGANTSGHRMRYRSSAAGASGACYVKTNEGGRERWLALTQDWNAGVRSRVTARRGIGPSAGGHGGGGGDYHPAPRSPRPRVAEPPRPRSSHGSGAGTVRQPMSGGSGPGRNVPGGSVSGGRGGPGGSPGGGSGRR